MNAAIKMPSQKLDPAQAEVLRTLEAGQRIEIIQTLRVGSRTWEAAVGGVFRHMNYLATGLSTARVPEDDIIVPMLHFSKDNGELSSVAIDENSRVRRV